MPQRFSNSFDRAATLHVLIEQLFPLDHLIVPQLYDQ